MYISPLGRGRLLHFTDGEEPAPVCYRVGGAGSYALLWAGGSHLPCLTGCEEPAPVLHRLGGVGSGTLPPVGSRLVHCTA